MCVHIVVLPLYPSLTEKEAYTVISRGGSQVREPPFPHTAPLHACGVLILVLPESSLDPKFCTDRRQQFG